MPKADSMHSTPPTNTSRSRRAVLAGIASAASLPIAAAMPTTAPAMPSPDEHLVKTANALLAVNEAIDQLHREHAASGAKGDADGAANDPPISPMSVRVKVCGWRPHDGGASHTRGRRTQTSKGDAMGRRRGYYIHRC